MLDSIWRKESSARSGRSRFCFKASPCGRTLTMAQETPFSVPISFDPDPSNPNFSSAFDALSLPDDDLSVDLTFPEGFMAGLGFEDDDLSFSIEDILLLPTSQSQDPPIDNLSGGSGISSLPHFVGEPATNGTWNLSSTSPGCGDWCLDSSRVLESSDRRSDADQVWNSASPGSQDDQNLDTTKFLNSPSPDSGNGGYGFSGSFSCDRGSDAASDRDLELLSDDRRSDESRTLNLASPDSSNRGQRSNDPVISCGSFDRLLSGSIDGNQMSGNARVLDSPSPDSGSASSLDSSNITSDAVTDQMMKLDEGIGGCQLKRKKAKEDGNPESRTTKHRRAILTEDGNLPISFCADNDEEEKRKARLMRNRESAQLSRQRKKHYVEELEEKVRSMHSTIADLNSKISFIMAENASLRQQLSGGSVCPPPPQGIFPPPAMTPMHFPWLPCAPYALKPQGSQFPLIPIPRLKPQQPVSAPKAKKADSKKAEVKKAESRTKKVSSVSFMGLVLFLLILRGLLPVVNDRYGGIGKQVFWGLDFMNSRDEGHSRGRVLVVSGHRNGSNQGDRFGLCSGKHDLDGLDSHSDARQTGRGSRPLPGSEGFGLPGNASEPLVASLYVPRNDKLVKIDGNLIIHSVLASEKALASSQEKLKNKNDKPTVSSNNQAGMTDLAIASKVRSALALPKSGRNHVDQHSHMYRSNTEHPKALGSGSGDTYGDNMKSTANDGALQEWFREGLAGPILSSGMCTEVFQFEVTPALANPGAIIPASSVANVTEHHPNPARARKMKNRRFLYHPPIPLNGTTLNRTGENAEKPPEGSSHFQVNKSLPSSMVVSVLVDPREAGDGNGDGMVTPKSLSRIFVVVLLDSVKYVTYSCVLPLKSAASHLVTT